MTNKEVIEFFYSSFSRGDAEAMSHCYADDIVFSDPAFGELKGDDVKNMWRMLIQRSGGNIKITYGVVQAGENEGAARWKAEYIFTTIGRKVVNHISASFKFRDGKITNHVDRFSIWKWSRQALGWKGLLLGWTPMMRNKIQKQTNGLLKTFQSDRI